MGQDPVIEDELKLSEEVKNIEKQIQRNQDKARG